MLLRYPKAYRLYNQVAVNTSDLRAHGSSLRPDTARHHQLPTTVLLPQNHQGVEQSPTHCTTNYRQQSFFHRTTKEWNSLPRTVSPTTDNSPSSTEPPRSGTVSHALYHQLPTTVLLPQNHQGVEQSPTHCTTNYRQQSFFHRTTKEWNSLPRTVPPTTDNSPSSTEPPRSGTVSHALYHQLPTTVLLPQNHQGVEQSPTHCTTNYRQQSFFHRTTKEWNSLPRTVSPTTDNSPSSTEPPRSGTVSHALYHQLPTTVLLPQDHQGVEQSPTHCTTNYRRTTKESFFHRTTKEWNSLPRTVPPHSFFHRTTKNNLPRTVPPTTDNSPSSTEPPRSGTVSHALYHQLPTTVLLPQNHQGVEQSPTHCITNYRQQSFFHRTTKEWNSLPRTVSPTTDNSPSSTEPPRSGTVSHALHHQLPTTVLLPQNHQGVEQSPTHCITNYRQQSFFHRTTKEWNSLPADAVALDAIGAFNAQLATLFI